MKDTPGWASPGPAPSDGDKPDQQGAAQPADQSGSDQPQPPSKWSKEQPPPAPWSNPSPQA
ncbi:hypothetical protein PV398_25990, partial [Streptomyces ipomoeae]|nr:hypothetical protein [Streptomyces ipomoeae]